MCKIYELFYKTRNNQASELPGLSLWTFSHSVPILYEYWVLIQKKHTIKIKNVAVDAGDIGNRKLICICTEASKMPA
jgi:hypothetical protein